MSRHHDCVGAGGDVSSALSAFSILLAQELAPSSTPCAATFQGPPARSNLCSNISTALFGTSFHPSGTTGTASGCEATEFCGINDTSGELETLPMQRPICTCIFKSCLPQYPHFHRTCFVDSCTICCFALACQASHIPKVVVRSLKCSRNASYSVW